MALTLAEASKLSNDILLQGVIETIIHDSPVLQQLPFVEIVGNGITYNQENEAATVNFYDVGDTWQESTPTFTQVTATLKILGGDADVDNFLAATRSNIQDLEAAVIQLKGKALQHKFDDTFINGDTSVDAKSFDGLAKLCSGDQQISMGANGGTLTLTKLDELIDLVKGGKPNMLLMSRRSRRKLTSLQRNLGSIEMTQDQFGNFVGLYDGIPIGDALLELQGRIEQLEEGIASRDREVAALKDSLAGSVAKYRAAVMASAPEVPEDLLKGETVEEIDASLELAQGIVAKVRQQFESDVAARSVPAGAPPRTLPDLSALPPGEKIAYALARQQT